MEGQPSDAQEKPLKVCPHCSVASRTDSETCPSCGKSYVRGGGFKLQWSWWLAIPIVIAAFAIGYFGISQLFDSNDTEDGVITSEQAESVSAGASRAELDEALDGEQPATTRADCLIYLLDDPPPKVKAFCFVDDKLAPPTEQGDVPPAVPSAP